MTTAFDIATRLSHVDGQRCQLRIAGAPIADWLAGTKPFLSVAAALHGNTVDDWESASSKLRLTPPPLNGALPLMRALRVWCATDGFAVDDAASMSLALSARVAGLHGSGSHVEAMARSLIANCSDIDVLAFDRALAIHAEHALNPGTLAVRVAASTGACLASCISAGLSVLEGPLHGGASTEAGALLSTLLPMSTRDRGMFLLGQRRVPGFGHPVYRGPDPRAPLLRQLCVDVVSRHGAEVLRAADDAATHMLDRGLHPNVDFFAACLYRTWNLPSSSYTPLFAAARVVGWCAHVAEQRTARQIISPEARYEGPT
jgi:citrate synthase